MDSSLLPAVGVGTPLGFGIPAPQLVSYAAAADDAGLDDVSVGELRSTEVFGLASGMIAATSAVRVETSIVAAVTRSAPLMAMACATLGQLSEGRFHLGLGAGSPIVAGWHGEEFKAPLSKVERTMDRIRAALRGDRLEDCASFHIAQEMVGEVPIILSAMNRRMIELAGRKADGVVLQFCGPEQAAAMGKIARDARRSAGVDTPFEVIVNVWGFGGKDRSAALQAFRREISPYMAVPTYRSAAVALLSEAEVDRVGAEWQKGGRDAAAKLVPESLSDSLLFILGTDDVVGRLADYRRAGVDRVHFVPLTPTPGDDGNARAVVDQLSKLSVSRRANTKTRAKE